MKKTFLLIILMAHFAINVVVGQQQLEKPLPLYEVVKTKAQPVQSSGKTYVPIITWGGDVPTIFNVEEGIFASEGLNVELTHEDVLAKQVENALLGKTPYIRGTLGMINQAVEVFTKQGINLVSVEQLTWSTGGDALVVRKNIKKPSDLQGKTIALQIYGPHVDYILNILANAGIKPHEVKFKWFKELTLPKYETGGKIVDPVTAFQQDPTIDAVMCIIPDAILITAAEGGVQGAKILLSSKTASRVIADVYAVREDFFKSNYEDVEKFVHALFKGQEKFDALVKNKKKEQTKFMQTMKKAGDIFQLPPTDTEGMLGDCEFVGYNGNVQFFTGKGTTRNLKTLNSEIQQSFIKLGLMTEKIDIASANWDYAKLAVGLTTATTIPQPPKEVFDKQKTELAVTQKIQGEAESWGQEGTLFETEIYFAARQTDFTIEQYANDFAEALYTIDTYGGALIVIEGHADPTGIDGAKAKAVNPVVIQQMEQDVKNKSYARAQEAKNSFIKYCKSKGITVDASRFVTVGMGIKSPKFAKPKSERQWNENRRVIFRVMSVEGESSEFVVGN